MRRNNMTSIRKATEYRDKALQVGATEAAQAFGVKVRTIQRAIQQVDKALREGSSNTTPCMEREDRKKKLAEMVERKAREDTQLAMVTDGEGTTLYEFDEEAKSPERVMEDARQEIAGWKERKLHATFEGVAHPTGSRVLIIGDLHEPFCLDSYFDHCCSVYDQYECDRVVFIGDIIDSHYSSYHEADPDGMGGGDELELAISRLQRWHDKFPHADSILGNHCRLIRRKAFSGGIPKRWVREMADVLEVPSWKFSERVVIDGVQYIHGEGGTARTKSRKDMMSTVQGHLHTQAYTEWTVGAAYKIFGCQVGCGIDHEAYAMSYARNFGKPAIGCAVVLYGKTCINELADLGGE
jgi:hypothetical protein